MAKFARSLNALALIIFGIVVGVGIALMVQGAAEATLTATVALGFFGGFALFVLFVCLRSFLTPARITPEKISNSQILRRVVDRIASKTKDEDCSESYDRLIREASETVSSIAAVWTAASALAAGVALVGGVFAAIASLAALRQVERLDKQNELISTQIIETQATREVEIFAALLGVVLEAIGGPASQGARRLNLPRHDAPAEDPPEIPSNVIASVNAVLTSFTPFRAAKGVPTKILLSPEKGRVFVAMSSANFRFDALAPSQRIDFSSAEFTAVDLKRQILGYLDLSGADLRSLDLREADLSNTILLQALVPQASALAGARLRDVDLTGAFVPSETWLLDLATTPSQIDIPPEYRCDSEFYGVYADLPFDQWRVDTIVLKDGTLSHHWITKNAYAVDLVDLIEQRYAEVDESDGIVDEIDVPVEEFAELSKLVQSETYGDPQLYGGHPSLYRREHPRNRSRGRMLEFMAGGSGWRTIPDFLEAGGSFKGALILDKTTARLDVSAADGADFSYAALSGVSFEGASLIGANFESAILPEASRFAGADVTGASFSGAYVDEGWISDLMALDLPPKGFDPEAWQEEVYVDLPIYEDQECKIVDSIRYFQIDPKN